MLDALKESSGLLTNCYAAFPADVSAPAGSMNMVLPVVEVGICQSLHQAAGRKHKPQGFVCLASNFHPQVVNPFIIVFQR